VRPSPFPRRVATSQHRIASSGSAPLRLNAVTSLMSFDGSWRDAKPLCRLVDCHVKRFRVLSGEAEAQSIFATIVGLAILRARFAHLAPAWGMIEAKSVNWLATRCPIARELIESVVRQLADSE
jgi:hypothetical protein